MNNLKPKRTKSGYLDTWEPPTLPDAPQRNRPERELWATVIGLAVGATKKGSESALYWINDSSFLQLCGMLDLHPDTGKRIREEVNRRFNAKYGGKRSSPTVPVEQCAKPHGFAPLPARPAIASPRKAPNRGKLPPAPAEAVAALWKPLPVAPVAPWKPLEEILPDPTGWQSWLD